jgi:hypothetical protein
VQLERLVRLYSPDMVRQGSRLKTGADKPTMKLYAGRAEFFALPDFAPSPRLRDAFVGQASTASGRAKAHSPDFRFIDRKVASASAFDLCRGACK